jgi:hypothetical protein
MSLPLQTSAVYRQTAALPIQVAWADGTQPSARQRPAAPRAAVARAATAATFTCTAPSAQADCPPGSLTCGPAGTSGCCDAAYQFCLNGRCCDVGTAMAPKRLIKSGHEFCINQGGLEIGIKG